MDVTQEVNDQIEREALASLTYNAGYKVLLRHLADYNTHLLFQLSFAKTSEEILRLTRFWQWFVEFYILLRDYPQQIKQDMALLGEKAGIQQLAPDPETLNRMMQLFEQFNRVPTEDDKPIPFPVKPPSTKPRVS